MLALHIHVIKETILVHTWKLDGWTVSVVTPGEVQDMLLNKSNVIVMFI